MSDTTGNPNSIRIEQEERMKNKQIGTGLAALFMIFQLTACGASTEAYDTGMNKFADIYTTADAVYCDTAAEAEMGFAGDYKTYTSAEVPKATGSTSAAGNAETNAANDLSARKIIKNANVRYETRTYDEFLSALSACIRKHGAYIESEESYGAGPYDMYSTRSTYMTVRVPLDTYDSFMQESGTLGSVTYKSETSTDVTMAYVDTESRIKSLQTEYDALLAILEKAAKLDDIISLQARISEVTYQLELHRSQLRKYDDLIAYCTVRIDVAEVEKVTPNVREMTFGEKIRTGLDETFEDIGRDASDFAVWFVTSLPYFVIWGVVIAAVLLIIRLRIARRRKRSGQQKNEGKLPNTEQKTTEEHHETNTDNDSANS